MRFVVMFAGSAAMFLASIVLVSCAGASSGYNQGYEDAKAEYQPLLAKALKVGRQSTKQTQEAIRIAKRAVKGWNKCRQQKLSGLLLGVNRPRREGQPMRISDRRRRARESRLSSRA